MTLSSAWRRAVRRVKASHPFVGWWAVGAVVGAAVFATGAAASPTTFDCVTEPSLSINVGSAVESIIASVDVHRGDTVKRGQVLAHIQSAVEEAVVAADKARAASIAEIEAKQAVLVQKTGIFKRKLELEKEHVSSSQDVENAQADYNFAKQEVALAVLNRQLMDFELKRSEAELEQRTIRSPIDGTVTKRSLGPGEFANQQATIVSIARLDPLHVEAFLPVSYYKLIELGEVAIVHPNDPFGGNIEAKVSVVDKVFDAASGTFGVRLDLPNPSSAVPAGLRCRVTFNVNEQPPSASEIAKEATP